MSEISLHTFYPFTDNDDAKMIVHTLGNQEIWLLRVTRKTKVLDYAQICSTLTNQMSNRAATCCCLTIENISDNRTTLLLVTKEFHLTQTIDHLGLTDANILSAVTDFLSFRNDGTVTQMLIDRNLHITTMESCTSGLIASNITDYEGSSSIFQGAHITYSNEAKVMTGIQKNILDVFGVYSPETAMEMARNAKMHFHSDIAIGITGSFSNVDPANPDSVAGEVHYQILTKNEAPIHLIFHNLDIPRKELKQKTVDIVLATLYAMLKSSR